MTIYDLSTLPGQTIIRARIPTASSSLLHVVPNDVEVQLNVTAATFNRASTRYTITVDDGAFLDGSGTPILGIPPYRWILTTRPDLHSGFTQSRQLSALASLTLHLPSPLPSDFQTTIQQSLANSLAIPTSRIEIVSVDGNGDPTYTTFRILPASDDDSSINRDKSPAALLDDLRTMIADYPASAVYQQPLLATGSPTLASATIEPSKNSFAECTSTSCACSCSACACCCMH